MKIKIKLIALHIFFIFCFLSCSDNSTAPTVNLIDGVTANKQIVINSTNATVKGISSVFQQIILNSDDRINFLQIFQEKIRFLTDSSGYFFSYDTNFVCAAHPILKSYIGQNHYEDVDSKGKHFPYEMKDSLSNYGMGWIEYYWYDQLTKTDDLKLAYVKMINNTQFWLGTGIFADILKGWSISENDLNKEIVKEIVNFTAIAFSETMKNLHLDTAAFNKFLRCYADSSRFLNDNSGYFFVDALNGLSIAFPTRKELEGTSIWDMTDAKGNYKVREMCELIGNSGSGFIEYYFKNPVNNEIQLKTVYVEKIQGTDYFLGAGFYNK